MPRATLEEVKEFANKVREAGGANPLDALMPAVPQESYSCLIARNLNFNCSVAGTDKLLPTADDEDQTYWGMFIEDPEVRQKIADSLGLEIFGDAVILPEEIGDVAATFDNVWAAVLAIRYGSKEQVLTNFKITEEDIIEFWPYIEEAKKEAYNLATFINEDGEIVI